MIYFTYRWMPHYRFAKALKGSTGLIEQACASTRPARTQIFDIFQNDAVVAHFAGRPLDGTDDEEVMIRAAANALDGTRHVKAPYRRGELIVDEAGNVNETARWTCWIKTHAFTAPEQ